MIWSENSRVLLVVFSGLGAGNRPSIPYHYGNFTRRFTVNKLYVRDRANGLYHFGLQEISENIDETADFLKRLISDHDIRKIVMLGVSAGAYAALLLGWLIEPDEIHAVTPVTYIDRENRLKFNDTRSDWLYQRVYDSGRGQEQYYDLQELFRGKPDIRTRFHIYYGYKYEIDRRNAERMQEFPCIRLHKFEGDGHFLARDLVLREDFNQRLDDALREPA